MMKSGILVSLVGRLPALRQNHRSMGWKPQRSLNNELLKSLYG